MKTFYVCLGWVAFALGAIGLVLPVVPTIPFLILAAFSFSKGSPRLHKWLLNLPRVGKQIEEWEKYRVIRKRAKVVATLLILSSLIYPFFISNWSGYVKGAFAVVIVSVLAFIWSCPSTIEDSKKKA